MFEGILNFFIVVWQVKKRSVIIPQHETGQINLTASKLKNKCGAHQLCNFKKKGDYY